MGEIGGKGGQKAAAVCWLWPQRPQRTGARAGGLYRGKRTMRASAPHTKQRRARDVLLRRPLSFRRRASR